MESPALYAAIGVIIVICCIVAYQMFKRRNNGEEITIDDFTAIYGAAIIKALLSAVKILSVNKDEFETEEDYKQAVIYQAIEELKSNATTLGVDMSIINLFSTEALVAVISNLLDKTLNMHVTDAIKLDDKEHDEVISAANSVIDEFAAFSTAKTST